MVVGSNPATPTNYPVTFLHRIITAMSISLDELISVLKQSPETVNFQDVIDVINANYHFTPTRFTNGKSKLVINDKGTNEGSCRIFAFAHLHNLTPEQTLHCFGDYYRCDVMKNPQGTDHGNIRQFISDGWEGIHFDQLPLSAKS